jgi:hypothetical protein
VARPAKNRRTQIDVLVNEPLPNSSISVSSDNHRRSMSCTAKHHTCEIPVEISQFSTGSLMGRNVLNRCERFFGYLQKCSPSHRFISRISHHCIAVVIDYLALGCSR